MNRKQAHKEAIWELEQLQNEMQRDWIDKSLPADWSGLDFLDPVTPPRKRVTLRLDEDMVRWFRRLGPGYGARINRVLRVYYTSVMAGYVSAYPDDDTLPRFISAARQQVAEVEEGRRALQAGGGFAEDG
ncbi:MAG: BrnA antitoxin family protein [Sulfitobacter sp.]